MFSSAIRSASRTVARPATAQSAFIRSTTPLSLSRGNVLNVGKRFNTQESRGGKSKLIFRFGLRDIPVELYPMAFVVGAACVGAGFAVARHFYVDGLRVAPAGKHADGQ